MSEKEKLCVVWSSADREVALSMVFMYTYNSKKRGWWKEVRLVVWGPSARLASEDKEIQDYIKKMGGVGVELLACKACADMFGAADKLADLGIDVIYMGEPMTSMLKEDWAVMTF